jgi:hypothetical protein
MAVARLFLAFPTGLQAFDGHITKSGDAEPGPGVGHFGHAACFSLPFG